MELANNDLHVMEAAAAGERQFTSFDVDLQEVDRFKAQVDKKAVERSARHPDQATTALC